MRLPDVEQETGIHFDWRPFSVRTLVLEMDNIPFVTKPVKEAYMWRDVERRARHYGVPARVPVPYPLSRFDLANEIAVLARSEGWCEDYVRSTYRYWFQEGLEAGGEANLTRVLAELGQDMGRVLADAQSDAVRDAYATATAEARARQIFGVPSFTVGDEVFWGDDRLEDALAFYRSVQR